MSLICRRSKAGIGGSGLEPGSSDARSRAPLMPRHSGLMAGRQAAGIKSCRSLPSLPHAQNSTARSLPGRSAAFCVQVCRNEKADSPWYCLLCSPQHSFIKHFENQSSGQFLRLNCGTTAFRNLLSRCPPPRVPASLVRMQFLPQEETGGRPTAGWLTLI